MVHGDTYIARTHFLIVWVNADAGFTIGGMGEGGSVVPCVLRERYTLGGAGAL